MKNKHIISTPETDDDPFLRDAQEGWSQFPHAGSRWWKKRLSFSFFLFGKSWGWLPAAGKLAVGTFASAAIITVVAVTIPFGNDKNNEPQMVSQSQQQTSGKNQTIESTIEEQKDIKDEEPITTLEDIKEGEKYNTKTELSSGEKLDDMNFVATDNEDMDFYAPTGIADIPVLMETMSSSTLDGGDLTGYDAALPFVWVDQYRLLDYDALATNQPSSAKKEYDKSLDARFSNHSEKTNIEESVVIDTIPYKTFVGGAIMKLKYGNYDEAEYQFKQLLVQSPKDENAIFYLGVCAFKKGNYIKAISYFDQAMDGSYKAFATDAQWYSARSLLLKGDKDKAKAMLKKIIKEKGFYYRDARDLLKKEFGE
ncbi:MAG: hypothetical protein CVU11_11705 [Bacteroidetes bacterium HGW-Bacteroidetes-6]|jgi:TolA-binding protein|nr:MAG: hypothetical protein CVU11_11705 [Bacteroidetes bacterium HGW-Bacteroidetes-6]